MVILTMNVQINIKKLKIKNLLDMFFYLYIDGDSNFIQFHNHLMVYEVNLKTFANCIRS
jgi:hypothetical protein